MTKTPFRLLIAALACCPLAVLAVGGTAEAGIVPTVLLGTAGDYSVLAGSTVTNTGPSVLAASAGLSPGTDIVGFPPGIVLAPGIVAADGTLTQQAQVDLTAAYVDAAARPVQFIQTNPDLVGLTLAPGVYAGTSKSPLALSGQLVLDGQNDPNAVFIFQTDSTLITGSGSSIALINGASECNIFWQVGSSATLGSGSFFVGNILANASVTVNNGVTVHGRALARTAAVTLDNDTFVAPSCVPTTDTVAPATTTTTTAGPGGTVAPVTTVPPGFTNVTLPATGRPIGSTSTVAAAALLFGLLALVAARRRQPS
jgi:LPXTG-motif cell wall-anchored protein